MTNLTRIVSLLLIVVMAVVVAAPAPPAALAQGDDCPDTLSAEDCALLDASSAAMYDAATFRIADYTLSLQFRADGDTTALNTSGTGTVEFDTDNLLQLDLTFDPATSISASEETTGAGALRLNNDGVWLGVGETGAEPDTLDWAGLLFEMGMTDMGGMDDLGDALGDLGIDGDSIDLSFVTTTRGEDTEFNGETVAVFNTDIGGAEFLRSAFVNQALTGLAIVLLEGSELDPSLATILVATLLDTFAADLEENSTIRFTQYVSPETNLVTYVAADIDVTLDLSLIAGFAEDVPSAGLGLVMDFEATLDEHGEPVTATAPAEFDDVTEMLEMLGDDLFSGDLFGLGDLGFGGGQGDMTDASITPEAADADIALDTTVEGTLTPDDDRDLYRFEGTAGQTIQIAMVADDTNVLDTLLEVYSADSVLLERNDDGIGTAPEAFGLDRYDSYLTFELPEDGVYVLSAASLFSLMEAADYTLTIQTVE